MITQEVRDRLLKKLKKSNPQLSNTAYFGAVRKNGEIEDIEGAPCHGGLRRLHNVDLCIWSSLKQCQYNQNVLYKEDRDLFYKMLMCDSAYSKLFNEGDYEQAMEDGFVLVSCENEINISTSFLIASRHTWEYPANVKHTVELYKRGVNPMLSLYIGMLCTVVNGKVSLSRETGIHDVVSRYWGATGVRNFTQLKHDTSDLIKKSTNYNNIMSMWGPDERGSQFCSTLEKILSEKKVVDKKKYVHPFPKYSKFEVGVDGLLGAVQFDYDGFYDLVASMERDIFRSLSDV